jgi:hypothetical protein
VELSLLPYGLVLSILTKHDLFALTKPLSVTQSVILFHSQKVSLRISTCFCFSAFRQMDLILIMSFCLKITELVFDKAHTAEKRILHGL